MPNRTPAPARRAGLTAASLLLALSLGTPAQADERAERRHPRPDRSTVEDARRVLREHRLVPARLDRDDARGLRAFFAGREYDRDHRHAHARYRLPVRTAHGVEYRPYSYCNDRLYSHSGPRPQVWVDWRGDDAGWYEDAGYEDHDYGRPDPGGYDGDWRDEDWRDRDRRDRRDDDCRYEDCRDDERYRERGRGRRGYGRIPPGHLPPPGECRVWYDDRPAGHQPPPTDCGSARRDARRTGGRVIYGGGR